MSARDAMLDHLGDLAGWASLHTADPAGGANEANAERVPVHWRKAVDGQKTTAKRMLFKVPPGTVSHFGLWSAPTGGVFYDGDQLDTPQTFAGAGTYSLDSITLTQD